MTIVSRRMKIIEQARKLHRRHMAQQIQVTKDKVPVEEQAEPPSPAPLVVQSKLSPKQIPASEKLIRLLEQRERLVNRLTDVTNQIWDITGHP